MKNCPQTIFYSILRNKKKKKCQSNEQKNKSNKKVTHYEIIQIFQKNLK